LIIATWEAQVESRANVGQKFEILSKEITKVKKKKRLGVWLKW
jgi:hypothetical protein